MTIEERLTQLHELRARCGQWLDAHPVAAAIDRRTHELAALLQSDEASLETVGNYAAEAISELERLQSEAEEQKLDAEPLTTSEHGAAWERLKAYAERLGLQVFLLPSPGDGLEAQLWNRWKAICVDEAKPVDQRVRSLIHELAHYLIEQRWPRSWGQPKEEVLVEAISTLCCRQFGLDSSSYAVPYIATWGTGAIGGTGALVEKASLIHDVCTEIEGGLAA